MISDDLITYSPKVFIPLTKLCRDVCHYCTFAHPPRAGERAFLMAEDVLAIARTGADAGCTEALFTLGDKPERRYRTAKDELSSLGHTSTISYLAEMADLVLRETGLLPHLNPGVMTAEDIAILRPVSASMGIMLEGIAPSLANKGGPHYGSPDKDPAARLETIRLAGEARVPFTTGILIGIGETRDERLAALCEIEDLQDRYGHIQEIIIQNFRAKPGTRMANMSEPTLEDLKWTIGAARDLFGPNMPIQAPPNLTGVDFPQLVDAGLSDWGGVSPVTCDHVNPEAPWPEIVSLREGTASKGRVLVARLPIYPHYIFDDGWLDDAVRPAVLRSMDIDGLARDDRWSPGLSDVKPVAPAVIGGYGRNLRAAIDRAAAGKELTEAETVGLLEARGAGFSEVTKAADDLRQSVSGNTVTFTVNRNINYTNVCGYRCGFCAFSKGRLSANLRGAPYDLALSEIARRTEEAWTRGATEVCLQGGIHPDYSGETYLAILDAVKTAAPEIHVHAFSPLEISQGAATMGLSLAEYLGRLRDAGLGSLPGTAAEILDDDVRAVLCADKVSTDEWLEVMEAAHSVGLRSTATIMFGHLERSIHQAKHLLRLRELQKRTAGFTEFVPLPFVHMEAPIYLKGIARRGPTFRESILMHAVARLVLNPFIPNIQASWVKLGPAGAMACLKAGANDLGGTLMNETISRAAGAAHGQEFAPEEMELLIADFGRVPKQRSTLYQDVSRKRIKAGRSAAGLDALIQTPASKFAHGEVTA
ncbi:MAG: 5-amino-6-(D-ribitylamino)uracil--L-tyrosine 4-hydroxyphenyl transferase CofH [Pseudomonadota bacterium]|nr:5-amino-6-(D-ribitylamino)uracil--L-tyrosine 4-hydroxyphenyl transferase CofH [Pseudomonadota bacterium]